MQAELKKIFFSLDAFARIPTLNYKRGKHYSFLGSLLSQGMYIFLLIYTIWRCNDMFTSTHTSSLIVQGLGPPHSLSIQQLKICVYSDDKDSYQSGQEIEMQNGWSYGDKKIYSDGLCMNSFTGGSAESTLSTDKELRMKINFESFGNSGFFRIFFSVYQNNGGSASGEFHVNDLPFSLTGSTVEGYWSKESAQNHFIYTFDKNTYIIDNSFMFSTTNTYNDLSLASSETSESWSDLGSYGYISVRFSGSEKQIMVALTKFAEILAEISGLYGLIVILINIAFRDFFNYKFFENLANTVKGYAIRISLYQYICYKLNIRKSELQDFEKLVKAREELEERLDVVVLLQNHPNWRQGMHSQNNSLEKRVKQLEQENSKQQQKLKDLELKLEQQQQKIQYLLRNTKVI